MISPLAYVNPDAKIGKDVTIHPFAYIDKNVEIGDNCTIMPYASILSGTRMGTNNTGSIREPLSGQLRKISSLREKIPF